MDKRASATQFVILAGKLGSGKTSLIEATLEAGDLSSNMAVIVNEVGAVNIDGAVLSESARGVAMATLSNGCVCCSLTNDLVTTVEDLISSRSESCLPPFERIILECSGLSRPGQVMGALAQLSQQQFRVHIVGTYDCSRPPLNNDGFDDAVAQLSAAHTIVLTKVDLISSEWREISSERARGLNPLAHVVNEFSLTIRARKAFSYLEESTSLDLSNLEKTPMNSGVLLHPRVKVFRARFVGSPEWEQALDWFENIAGAMGERLLRMKSIVAGPQGDERVLLQSVGTTFAAPRRLTASNLPQLSAVFIVRDCSMQELEDVPAEFRVLWTSQQG